MDAVEFPSHRHPLNRKELLSGEETQLCGLCGKEVINGPAYECSKCNFTAHLDCVKNPPSLVIEKSKIHEHTLTLLPRHVSFTCNACGRSGNKSPYVCLKCSFMAHGDCINIPLVIKISRHLHRLSHTCFLGPGEWSCEVCHLRIDGKYGAYNCQRCLYTVHLRCVLRADVWDGKELEGEPEEYKEIESSKLVGEKLVHQHDLRLVNEDIRDHIVCSGCSLPVASNPFYRCLQCHSFFHERCANHPQNKITFLHVHPLTLYADDERSGPNTLSRCDACDLHFSGFGYRCLECKDGHIEFDVRCSSVAEPFDYRLHPGHPLFLILPANEAKICNVCNHLRPKYVLSCLKCDFNLCFACATLPDKVIYKYDEHLLSDTIGEDDATNPYWCDICENKIEVMRNHYTCTECGPVLHTECVLGSFRNMSPGFTFITQHGHKYEVILNDRTSLLRCNQCHKDCHEPLLLMSTTTNTDVTSTRIYLCSSPCFRAYVSV
ncbi:unnamed protein product [Arabidopsis halleri]